MNILLVHGMGRTPTSMFRLGAAFRRAGRRTCYFGYFPTFESLPAILARLSRRLQKLAALGEPIGLAAHSLGGLLLRIALHELPEVPVHHLVMMGTPNRPPRLAAWFWQWRLFRAITRDCGRLLASPDAIPSIPPPHFPYTLIAGTQSGFHSRLAFGDEPNDGIVAVSETRIHDRDQPLLVPAIHSFLMDNRAVQQAAIAAMMTSQTFHSPSS